MSGKVMQLYTEKELNSASIAFAAMDKTSTLPRGRIEAEELRDYLFLAGIETHTEIEYKIDELVWLYDKNFSDSFDLAEFYLIK